MQTPSSSPDAQAGALSRLFLGGGKLGELLQKHPWEASAFGPPNGWSSSLRASLSLCLNTRIPSCIYWGADMHMLYNDAWSLIPGKRHPGSLGQPAHEVWETQHWNEIGALVRQVMHSGESGSVENHLLTLEREGSPQECYFTHTGSAIRGEDGGVLGVFNGSIETTQTVVTQRRARILGDLSEALFQSEHGSLSANPALQALGSAAQDVPFLGYFERERPGNDDILLKAIAGATLPAMPAGSLMPSRLSVTGDGRVVLPFASDAPPTADALPARWQIFDLDGHASAVLPRSIWGLPVERMLLLPLAPRSSDQPVQAWLLCGLSPLAPMDAQYRAFFDSVSSLLGASLAGRVAEEAGRRNAALSESALLSSGFGTWSYGPRSEESSPAHIVVTEHAGQLLAGRSAFPRTAQAAGKHPAQLEMDPQTQQTLTAAMNEALEREQPLSLRLPLPATETPDRWLLVQGGIDRDPEGRPRLTGVVGDVSQQHREQQELCENNKLAVVRRLTATIAHEMNNPLESLTNLLYLASLDEALSPSTLQMLQLAEGELARVSFTAQQTLGFHRDASGPVHTDISLLIAELVLLLERRAESRSVHADLSRVRPVSLLCRQSELRQILSNLLTNAFAASSRDGRIVVSARLSRHHRTAEEVLRIAIADSGKGIAPADRKMIFNPFFTTHGDRGNGLGLWVTRSLLQRQQGTIRFRSRDKKPSGTCFMITLPIEARRSFVQ